MTQHIVYRLTCNCPLYNESLIPRTVKQHLDEMSPGMPVYNAMVAGFWTTAHEPGAVFEAAVNYLLEKQAEVRRFDQEEMSELFAPYAGKHLHWDPIEFETFGDDEGSQEAFLRYYGAHLGEAGATYRSMVEHIVLEPVELVSVAESRMIDRAVRFIKDPNHYRDISRLHNTRVLMDVMRNITNVKELVKQRLQIGGGIPSDCFLDNMGKMLHDLEHYFPEEPVLF